MGAQATSLEDVRQIGERYRDDLNGYRYEVLGRKPAGEAIEKICNSIVHNRRTSVASGHGIGKTGLSADAIHWFLSTRPNPAIVATANTEDQLEKKLWRELNLTNQSAANSGWFDWKAKTFTRFNDVTAQAVALAWSEQNSEAFAGTHAEDVLGVFDEASAIPKIIFEVFAGAMTTPGARWLAVGNSTRAEGYFYDATHGKLRVMREGDAGRGMWNAFVVPSWDSPFVTEEFIAMWEQQEGCDRHSDPDTWTDPFRIRVAGLPPKSASDSFFVRMLVDAAMKRDIPVFERWPLILGCDVGRGDRSVILPRRGRMVLDKVETFFGMRTMDFARRIAEEIRFYKNEYGLAARVVLEELGMGVGVVETLEDMGFDDIWGINTGESSSDPKLYLNLRCEMYALAKEWMEDVCRLPNLPALHDDLMKIRRKSTANGQLRLETKDEMRRRGEKSPDVGDALALTFALPHLSDLLPEKRDAWEDAWTKQHGPKGGGWMSA
jgi:hypothetical protein